MILFLVSGCAHLGGPGSKSVLTADKKFHHPLEEVSRATVHALNQMNIMILENASTPKGYLIQAATFDFDITISLSAFDSNFTQMSVHMFDGDAKEYTAISKKIINTTQSMMDAPDKVSLKRK